MHFVSPNYINLCLSIVVIFPKKYGIYLPGLIEIIYELLCFWSELESEHEYQIYPDI